MNKSRTLRGTIFQGHTKTIMTIGSIENSKPFSLAAKTTTHCLRGIKIWEPKFSLGRGLQHSEKGKQNVAEGEAGG